MILGFHVTISCYGHWLPNDPRGSGSRYVWSPELFEHGGAATKTNSHISVAHQPHNVTQRIQTKQVLKHPPVLLNPEQIETVASVITTFFAPIICVVTADHTHILLGPMEIDIDEVVMRIKEESVKTLLEKGIHPRPETYPDPRDAPASLWSRGCWKVYIDTPEHLEQAERYIERHRRPKSPQ